VPRRAGSTAPRRAGFCSGAVEGAQRRGEYDASGSSPAWSTAARAHHEAFAPSTVERAPRPVRASPADRCPGPVRCAASAAAAAGLARARRLVVLAATTTTRLARRLVNRATDRAAAAGR
jgi:hypothetical protein